MPGSPTRRGPDAESDAPVQSPAFKRFIIVVILASALVVIATLNKFNSDREARKIVREPPSAPALSEHSSTASSVDENKKFGLTEAERRRAFGEMVRRQDGAEALAQKTCPLPQVGRDGPGEDFKQQLQRQRDFWRELNEAAIDEVCAEFKITRDQLAEITHGEGIEKGWFSSPSR